MAPIKKDKKKDDKGNKSRKRKRTDDATLARTITRIVRRNAETKMAAFGIAGNTFTKEQLKSWNIMYSATFNNGTGAEDATIVGNDLVVSGIRIRMQAKPEQNYGVQFTIALVACDEYVTASNLTYTDLCPGFAAGVYPPLFSKDKCTVIGRRDYSMVNHITSVANSITIDEYFPIPESMKKMQFKDLATSYQLKGKNLYLVISAGSYDGTTLVTNIVSTGGQVVVYYKDP